VKQTAFLKCFSTQERVLADHALHRKRLMSGLWSTAHPIAKISKLKDLALILLISVFSLYSPSVKRKHLKQSFCFTFYSLI